MHGVKKGSCQANKFKIATSADGDYDDYNGDDDKNDDDIKDDTDYVIM